MSVTPNFQPDADHPLPEARRLLLLDQARPCELIDDLTQTDVVLSAQALRRSGDLGIDSYRSHNIIAASQIHESRIADASDGSRRPGLSCREILFSIRALRNVPPRNYSHSMVAGGLLVMSKTTRLTSAHSLVIRVEIFSSSSHGSFAQSAVMASSEVTGRSTMGCP